MFSELCCLVCVAALWGLTNPLIKRNSRNIIDIKANSWIDKTLAEFTYLITNYKYLIPLSVNFCGSVLYFIILQNVDFTMIGPATNSLTFIFTAMVGAYLEEQLLSKRCASGMVLILLGTSMCCCSRSYRY